ncbi:MAG: shikimate kinase [Betaproteobacteria bacterium]|nr:shikimate kinase [Betaproteobacteria bacterium]NBY05302.1 shikimate kinase [Betaproteobacteria bacterium]
MPGCGKSTVGRQLARRLDIPFVDSDHAIEQRLGCSIREYFERQGEARFREVETDVLTELARQTEGVLSTGGGSVLSEQNRALLRQTGPVFYLYASPQELFRRLRHDRKRPLLQVNDPLQRLQDLFALRDPLYRAAAHHVIESPRPSVGAMVQGVMQHLERSVEPAQALGVPSPSPVASAASPSH